MNIHSKLVGAFDAIILSLTAAVTLVMLLVLIDPSFDQVSLQTFAQRPSVVIEQIALDDSTFTRYL